MPLSSSSSNSSPISTSLLLQTETGCSLESSLLSNSITSNDNNMNKSIKNKTGTISTNSSSISQRQDTISRIKKISNSSSSSSFNTNNNGKTKANKKRKISASAASSIQLIPANSQSYTSLATSTVSLGHRSLIANCSSTSRIENTLQVKAPKLTSAVSSLLQPVDLHSLTDSSFRQPRQQRALTSFERITTQASVLLSTLSLSRALTLALKITAKMANNQLSGSFLSSRLNVGLE